MRNRRLILTVLLGLFLGNIYAQEIVTESYDVTNIQSISVSGNVDIYIKQGKGKTVNIQGTKGQHKAMHKGIKEEGISVSMKEEQKENRVKVYVSVSNLKSLAASSGAKVIFENEIKTKMISMAVNSGSYFEGTIDADEINCSASSGSYLDFKNTMAKTIRMTLSSRSDLKAKNISTNEYNLTVSSRSDIDIAGNCEEMNLVVSGKSELSASDFIIRNCSATISGSSDANIHVNGNLSIIVSSMSDVNCTGNPTIKNKTISKGSDFSIVK